MVSLMPCAPTRLAELASQFREMIPDSQDGSSTHAVRAAYEALVARHGSQLPMEQLQPRSLTQDLSACFRHAQLESLENRVRESAGLLPIWNQPIHTCAIAKIRDAGIQCRISVRALDELVRTEGLAMMGSRVDEFLRDQDGALQIRCAEGPAWQSLDSVNLAYCSFSDHGLLEKWRPGGDHVALVDFPLDITQEGFPQRLLDPNSKVTLIGMWSCDTEQIGHAAHHGVMVVDKQRETQRPKVALAGFLPNQSGRTLLMPVDAYMPSIMGARRSASASLYKVGSLELLHKIEAPWREDHFPPTSSLQEAWVERLV